MSDADASADALLARLITARTEELAALRTPEPGEEALPALAAAFVAQAKDAGLPLLDLYNAQQQLFTAVSPPRRTLFRRAAQPVERLAVTPAAQGWLICTAVVKVYGRNSMGESTLDHATEALLVTEGAEYWAAKPGRHGKLVRHLGHLDRMYIGRTFGDFGRADYDRKVGETLEDYNARQKRERFFLRDTHLEVARWMAEAIASGGKTL